MNPFSNGDNNSLRAEPVAQHLPTFTREEVQVWRDDIAHAAADIVARALLPQDAGWQWLVDSVRALAKSQPRTTNEQATAEQAAAKGEQQA